MTNSGNKCNSIVKVHTLCSFDFLNIIDNNIITYFSVFIYFIFSLCCIAPVLAAKV